MSYETATTTERFNDQLKSALIDAEELVKATAESTDENISRLRARATTSLRNARVKMAEVQDAVRVRANDAANAVEAHVHDKPWESLGMAAAGGLAIGLLAGIFLARE